ncbi:MAG: apolipoprotein N-acyltransferase, partial [Candidatus Cloacimonetes bacterium]|nr:apolipoprotein N-acyltransferase [Candidatus Cloacimonadota bacterium]
TRHEAGIFVMQPSIKQSEKWDRDEFFRIMKVYHERCMEAQYNDARLLIFPEAAIPEHIMLLDPDQVLMSQFLDTYKFDIFTGFPHAEYSEERSKEDPYKYYNAATLFRPGKQAGDLYYKIILVPVAERMPWLAYFPILWKLQFGQANWEYGTEIRYYKSGNYLFSPSICYEIAFSDLNLQMAVAKDSFSKNNPTQEPRTYRKSDYLVNITNDAWFGTSYGPWMHSIMARFRAIESRIQIYRSANTGISMIVSPTGRVLEKAGLFESQNITAPLYKSSRITLFRRIYLYPMAVTILALLLFLFAAIRKRSGGSNT